MDSNSLILSVDSSGVFRYHGLKADSRSKCQKITQMLETVFWYSLQAKAGLLDTSTCSCNKGISVVI